MNDHRIGSSSAYPARCCACGGHGAEGTSEITMRGYHWITFYGDYQREVEYALSRTKIKFEGLE